MCFLLFLRMLCQLSDHGVSLVKQVPIDDEETVCKVCEAIVTILSKAATLTQFIHLVLS